jgi:Rieske Fe-S protein
MDESLPVQETARRRFLKLVVGVFTAVNGLVLGIPVVAVLFGPVRKEKKADWFAVAEVGPLPHDQPVELKFEAEAEDAFYRSRALYSVWVIKHATASATVFSPFCTHLDCRFIWNASTEHFECPCHAGVFSREGKVLSGPAPRRLDTLEHRIENGRLFVKWERFKAGATEKVPV